MPYDHLLTAFARILDSPHSSRVTSTEELGQLWGVSQQTASRYLSELEREGLVDRRPSGRRQSVALTPIGVSKLSSLHEELAKLFTSKGQSAKIKGAVITGLGEGAYYVKQYGSRITAATGIESYPGTFNLRFSKPVQNFGRFAGSVIDGFESEGRKFGKVSIAKAVLSHEGRKVKAYLLIPERTHHTDQLEFVHQKNLRKELGVKDGDEVEVEIEGN
ncbi:Riboflavin kinase [uncultured archaeon]|nr:Riboflavin kinase [uncultured archaeon]